MQVLACGPTGSLMPGARPPGPWEGAGAADRAAIGKALRRVSGALGAPLRPSHLEQVDRGGRDPAELPGHPEVVAVGPVLDDLAVFEPQPVGLGHREGAVRRREDAVYRAIVGVEDDWGDKSEERRVGKECR